MKFKSILFFVFVCVGVLFAFQNCGSFDSKHSQSSDIDSDNAVLTVDDASFEKGQAFEESLVPFDNLSEEAVNAIASYSTVKGFKGMAFTENGSLYIGSSTSTNVEDQQEWSRIILERCQLANGGQPCSLLAAGDVFAQSAQDFKNGFVSIVQTPEIFDPLLIPGLPTHWRNYQAGIYYDYDAATEFRAYAIGLMGDSARGGSKDSQEEANRRALEFCESIVDSPCTLYAEGDRVVMDLSNLQWMPQNIQYGPVALTEASQVPFVTDKLRIEQVAPLINKVKAGSHMAIAIDRFGLFSKIESNSVLTEAQKIQVVSECSAKVPEPVLGGTKRSCVLYAVDDQIVMTREAFEESAF